jgi:hypothetical protein
VLVELVVVEAILMRCGLHMGSFNHLFFKQVYEIVVVAVRCKYILSSGFTSVR